MLRAIVDAIKNRGRNLICHNGCSVNPGNVRLQMPKPGFYVVIRKAKRPTKKDDVFCDAAQWCGSVHGNKQRFAFPMHLSS